VQGGKDLYVTELVEPFPKAPLDRILESSFGRFIVVYGMPVNATVNNIMRLFDDFIMLPPSEHKCDPPQLLQAVTLSVRIPHLTLNSST
jgi:hypothetical protein